MIDVVSMLEGVKATGKDRWIARCPAHDDRGPSLSIRDTGDKLLLHCFAGCDALDVVHALGLKLSDLFADSPTFSGTRPHSKRLPAADKLALIEREVDVVAIIAARFLEDRTITEADWERLASAVSRIGKVKNG